MRMAIDRSIPAKRFASSTAKQQMLRQLICSDAPEQALRHRGATLIAGVDEVGRGALFGPVVAAAVILPRNLTSLAKGGLTDSKQLKQTHRESLNATIRKMAIAVCVAEIDAETIDRVNIYQATRLAMLAAVNGLEVAPDHLLIDAMLINHSCAQTKLIYGDSLSLSIAAASVAAKVYRDNLMCQCDAVHPQYGFASHKGYGTVQHRLALQKFGPLPEHRRSFAPVGASTESLFGDGELNSENSEAIAWA